MTKTRAEFWWAPRVLPMLRFRTGPKPSPTTGLGAISHRVEVVVAFRMGVSAVYRPVSTAKLLFLPTALC